MIVEHQHKEGYGRGRGCFQTFESGTEQHGKSQEKHRYLFIITFRTVRKRSLGLIAEQEP